MAIFESVLENNIFLNFWKQFQQYFFSQNRIIQLVTFKPIEIYNEKVEIVVDTAKIQLHISSTLENLMKRGVDRTLSFFFTNRLTNKKSFQYDFKVKIHAHVDYTQVSNFFNFHFSNQTFPLDEVPEEDVEKAKALTNAENVVLNKYNITLGTFDFFNKGSQLAANLSFDVDAKWKFIKQKANGTITATAFIEYLKDEFLIRTRNLNYTLDTKNVVLNGIDRYYHVQIVDQLYYLLQYTFEAELEKVKEEAQLQINSIQENKSWISGTLNTLQVDKILIDDDGVHAVLFADGFVDLF
jgi:hypothetical protein